MLRLLYLLIGYGFGCLQSAYFVGKIFGKIDIREHGSGNAGMTNVTRVMGGKAGLLVGVLDVAKAMAAYIVVSLLFRSADSAGISGLYAGLGAILGHNFPFYLKFKGGKGVACMVGVIAMFNPPAAVVTFAIGVAAFLITRYISVGSLLLALIFPAALIFFHCGPEAAALGFIMAALCYYQHRANIGRLIHGNENKFSIGKKGAKRDE